MVLGNALGTQRVSGRPAEPPSIFHPELLVPPSSRCSGAQGAGAERAAALRRPVPGVTRACDTAWGWFRCGVCSGCAGSGAGAEPAGRSVPLSRRWLPRKRVAPFPVVVLRHFPVLMLSSQFLERQ